MGSKVLFSYHKSEARGNYLSRPTWSYVVVALNSMAAGLQLGSNTS